MNTSNLIYGYKKKSEDRIVYIGQTICLKDRHKQHIKYDPYNKNTKEYDYPLSRGIRKYGENEYELVIIEDNLKENELNDREKYWIKYYDTYWNGYNQTIGGKYPVKPIFTEMVVDKVIEMLSKEEYSYKDIMQKTGISMTHIFNINNGYRRKRENIDYPIRKSGSKGSRGIKLNLEENIEIHNLLLNTQMSFKEISKKFFVGVEVISDINAGRTKAYLLDEYNYPLRKNSIKRSMSKTTLDNNIVEQIHKELASTKKTYENISKEYNVSTNIIANINHGRIKAYILEGYSYPIRKNSNNKLSNEDLLKIYDLLRSTKLSMIEISKKFGVSDSTIGNINRGKTYYNPQMEYPIRSVN